MTAFGVFLSGFVKDFMCLPRPLSPPVHRLSMSKSTSLEYGFPSTHSTNSISVALFVVAVTCESVNPETRALIKLGAIVYAGSVVMGRIYCGMHSITDVVGGSILAYILYWFQWTFKDQFDGLFTAETIIPTLIAAAICLALVGLHPDPIERCPCFEDSVCFMGVLVGVFPGGWLCAHSDYCTMGQQTLALVHSSAPIAVAIVLAKLILGVASLFLWRIACKRVCYFILPPIYRAFNLPHRKFEIGARAYKSLNRESIHPIPSVLDLHDLSVKHAEHVGIQSSIDLHEKRAYDKVQYRGTNADGEEGCGGTNCNERVNGRHTKDVYDPTTELVAEDAPLRYDVDIVTKLIVYAGIGCLAVYGAPLMFQFCGLSS